MNRVQFYRSSAVLALILSLAACASAPGGPRGPRAAPVLGKPKPAPTRGYGEMAPIPNPRGDEAPAARPSRPAAPRATPPRPAAPAANPVRASQLRAQGLEQLNRGAVDRAIALLQQASQLDPSNALIKRDLDRAVRIGAAVKRK
jgi:Flp pilus assembly protein TadD